MAVLEGNEPRLGAILQNVALLAAYLTLNCTLNLLNKWSLGIYGFSFPLFMTVAHMLFSFIVLAPFMRMEPFKSQHKATLQKQWKGLLCIGAFMALNIALNNLSLVEITLSLNQVIRSAIPVVTALLAISIEKKVPSKFEGFSLLVLTSGVMVAVWEGAAGSPKGIIICIAGMVSNALMMTTSGRVLSERMDCLRLTFYTAPVSCVCLVPFYLFKESERLSEYAAEHRDGMFQLLLGVGCANALAYNVVHYLMIQRTSAVTTTVLGEIKIVGLLLLSALLLGEGKQMTLRMMIGCAVAIAGFCLYSHARMAAKPAGPPNGDPEAAGEKEALLPVLEPGKGGSLSSPSKLARVSSGERRQQTGGTIKAVRFDR
ncbi:g6947 [Coccomyxa elongata]